MFREMRRKIQQLTEAECVTVMERSTNGVLSVIGDDGYPYGVPLSYVYKDGKIWFHCAKSGHKIEAIQNCPKVSFTVVDQDKVLPQQLSTDYRSVIIFGEAKIMSSEEAALAAHLVFCDKYSHGYDNEIQDEIDTVFKSMYMVEIDVQHMTGKHSKRMAARQRAGEKEPE